MVSKTEMRVVGCMNVLLFIAAVVTLYSGVAMSWFHGEGAKEVSHAFLPTHLIFGLCFIGLGLAHMAVNRWWYLKAEHRAITNKFSLIFLPIYSVLFLIMAVTALLIWLFGVHECVPMHKICGYVFLGFVTVHALVRFGLK